jgi:hypothetical protein
MHSNFCIAFKKRTLEGRERGIQAEPPLVAITEAPAISAGPWDR